MLGALGRWGHDWAWSAPRENEAIDIGAILRIAPGLVEPPADVKGVAAFCVRVDAETTKHYALSVARREVSISETEQANPDVRVTGSQDDWIDALGPDADRSGLRIEGEERLARVLLDGVGAFAARDERVA